MKIKAVLSDPCSKCGDEEHIIVFTRFSAFADITYSMGIFCSKCCKKLGFLYGLSEDQKINITEKASQLNHNILVN